MNAFFVNWLLANYLFYSKWSIRVNWYYLLRCESSAKVKRSRWRNLSDCRPFCGLFQNPKGSIAVSTTTGHSRVTNAVNVTRGQTPWRGIYVKDAACCRNTIARFAAENSGARIICYATRTTSINRKILLRIESYE